MIRKHMTLAKIGENAYKVSWEKGRLSMTTSNLFHALNLIYSAKQLSKYPRKHDITKRAVVGSATR